MMDSGNILSILAALGQTPAPAAAPMNNVFQAVAPPDPGITPVTYQPTPSLEGGPINPNDAIIAIGNQGMSAPTQAAPAAPAEPPRKRRSVIETIGRIADVFAKVGGAEALYEPTLNARADRLNQVDMDALRKTLAQQQVTGGAADLDTNERKRIGTALGALSGREDAAALWPSIAEQAGIDPQKAAAIGQILQTSPNAASIFAKSLGADVDNLGKNVYFGSGPDGKTVAYQVGPDGQPHILDFSASGITPSDPTKVVNTGGSTVVLDSRGNPRRIIPNSVRPDTLANNQTQLTIAGMPARSAAGAKVAADPAAVARGAAPVVASLKDAVNRLHKSGGMTDQGSSPLDTASAVARENLPGYERFTNKEGFSARQDLNRLLTVGIPALLPLMGGLQLGGKNIDAAKELETWRKAIASAQDYPSAMRAIKGFEKRIQELTAQQPSAPAAARPKPQPGWSVVKVQ